MGVLSNPAPGFLLFWSSLIFGGLSIILVAKSVLGKGGPTKLADSWRDLTWWNPFITVIAVSLYSAILEPIGFVLAMFLLLVVLYALGRVKIHVSILGAGLTVFLAYVIFHWGLQVPFPKGMLGW